MVDSVEGFILVGGTSSRMGTDKSRLILNGLTFTEQLATVLAQITSTVRLVGSGCAHPGLEAVGDVFTHWGALGGLHAALAGCRREWSLVVACDLPFITPNLLARLAELRQDFEAVAPLQQNGFLQPLCALYRVDPCLERCEALIRAGERRPLALLEAVKSRFVKFDELSDLDDSEQFFDNINTPEDYSRARQKGASLWAKRN
jgi:molybdopterin-guanine dinucleotide biosynthesis protein A